MTTFKLTDESLFKLNALRWAGQFDVVCLLDSNDYPHDKYSTVQWILAVDALSSVADEVHSLDALKAFLSTAQEKVFGYLSYDLKNQIENLSSANPDHINFPLLYFFRPRYIIEIKAGKVTFNRNYPEAFEMYEKIMNFKAQGGGRQATGHHSGPVPLSARTSEARYLSHVRAILEQITAGDFYEINYCCEWFAEGTEIDPISVFSRLNGNAKAPFSAFFRLYDRYLLCSSPERFMKKTDDRIISQPIKGTIRRGRTDAENTALQTELLRSEKERAENVMIVDLVRNDLARSAKPGTVSVGELFGIYEFPTVNQMISTVTAVADADIHPVDIVRNAFPMGSMTGAPKVEVMKNIESYEDQRRGLYSGSVGYFTPDGDFDLNVVIRSIFYDAAAKYISVQAGSAITSDADPDAEYDELLLKAKGMMDALNGG